MGVYLHTYLYVNMAPSMGMGMCVYYFILQYFSLFNFCCCKCGSMGMGDLSDLLYNDGEKPFPIKMMNFMLCRMTVFPLILIKFVTSQTLYQAYTCF